MQSVYYQINYKRKKKWKKEKRNFNYFFPKEIDDFVDIVNEFSKRKMTKEEIIYEINSISLSKMKMLYTQVKSILDTKELQGSSNNQEEFEKNMNMWIILHYKKE